MLIAMAALAREVLDVQVYPDLRESPNGPLDQPYDAAGWTLPLQMGVDVATAGAPLSAEARGAMKALGPAFDVLVTGEPRLLLGRDRVDVVGAAQARDADVALGRASQERQHEVAGPVVAGVVDDVVERLHPLGRLVGVDVDVLGGESASEQRIAVTSWGHG